MQFLRLVYIGVFAVVIYAAITQVIIPLWNGAPLLPFFRGARRNAVKNSSLTEEDSSPERPAGDELGR